MNEHELILIQAGIEIRDGKIRKSDIEKALEAISAVLTEPPFMGSFVEELTAKGYALAGNSDMWRSPNNDDHTATNVVDAGNGNLRVRLRFNPDGKKVTQNTVYDDPEDSDSWSFNYAIKDESEVKSIVSSVCGALKSKLSKFKTYQNMATFEMSVPEGLEIPHKMAARK